MTGTDAAPLPPNAGARPPARVLSSARVLRWVAATAWAILLVGYAATVLVTERTPIDVLSALVTFLVEHPAGPVLFVLAYVLRPLVAFSAAVLTIGAGHLYGPGWGFLVVVLGANGGALLAYGLARWLGAGIAGAALGHPRLRGVTARLRTRTFETVLTLRFVFAPYDAVNYLAGALRLRPGPFLLATAIGSLPGTLTFVLFGASIGDLSALAEGRWPTLDPWTLTASAALFVATLGAARVLRR